MSNVIDINTGDKINPKKLEDIADDLAGQTYESCEVLDILDRGIDIVLEKPAKAIAITIIHEDGTVSLSHFTDNCFYELLGTLVDLQNDILHDR